MLVVALGSKMFPQSTGTSVLSNAVVCVNGYASFLIAMCQGSAETRGLPMTKRKFLFGVASITLTQEI